MLTVASRPPDFTAERERGWDSPGVKRALGRYLGVDIVGTVKAVADSSGGSGGTLIQQGVEPVLYEEFVRRFPLYDLFEKEESNGLVHAFDQWTAYSGNTVDQPVTMSEDASVSDDKNTYAQATTNIAIFGTRRGASLKSMFAVRQGTGRFGDLSERELDGGLIKIAHDVQSEGVRFQNTDNTGTTNTAPQGLYDANGFCGFRYQFGKTSSPPVPAANTISVNVSPGSGYTTASQAVLTALGEAGDAIVDAIGVPPDFIVCAVAGKRYVLNEQLQLRRYVDGMATEIRPGLRLATVELGWGEVPIYDLPGDAVGTIVSGGNTYMDIYLGVSSTISWPWLGGPTPVVLEIPIGADGTLRKLYIPFLMVGMAFHNPYALARVQLEVAA
jgi:hypothetical protein